MVIFFFLFLLPKFIIIRMPIHSVDEFHYQCNFTSYFLHLNHHYCYIIIQKYRIFIIQFEKFILNIQLLIDFIKFYFIQLILLFHMQ
jgi:hypothetical protein